MYKRQAISPPAGTVPFLLRMFCIATKMSMRALPTRVSIQCRRHACAKGGSLREDAIGGVDVYGYRILARNYLSVCVDSHR